jgi:hypothetical protein
MFPHVAGDGSGIGIEAPTGRKTNYDPDSFTFECGFCSEN